MSNFLTARMFKIMAGAPRLELLGLSKTEARPGDVVRISAQAKDAQGMYVSPFGDPVYMGFLRKVPADDCIGATTTSKYVQAEYKVRADAPEGNARMTLWLIRPSAPGECDANGGTVFRGQNLYVYITPTPAAPPPPPPPPPTYPPPPPPTYPPPPPPTYPPPVTPPPPSPLCKIPILRRLYGPCAAWVRGKTTKTESCRGCR